MGCVLRAGFPVHSQQSGSRGLSYPGTNLIHEGSTLLTGRLPKAAPPSTNTLGIWLQDMNRGRERSVYSRQRGTISLRKAEKRSYPPSSVRSKQALYHQRAGSPKIGEWLEAAEAATAKVLRALTALLDAWT